MEKILNTYYENNAKKLKSVVDRIFNSKYGGIAGKDMDEFYSVANDVFADIIRHKRYDSSKGDFDGFLYGALCLAFIDEYKRQNRNKRTSKIEVEERNEKGEVIRKKIPVKDVYLDTPIGEDGDITIGDTYKSDFDINNILFENSNGRIEEYLSSLSKISRKIIEMKVQGMSSGEIKKRLKLTNREFAQHFKEIKSFSNISILFKNESSNNQIFAEEETEMSTTTQTMESCKTDKISVSSIIKKIDRHTIRFDHPLQRESDQWSPSMKGNLVSDVLQGNRLHPLIFAEQIINGIAIIWDLDGKQRCTNVYSFAKDGYKVSKNIRRWNIRYQTTEKDENGKEILDENGFPIAKNAEFDIRNKRFSDLPEELQEKFLDYTFNYDQYLNCSEEDIGYHIERYNDGKPMNKSQKGVTKLGTEFAETVKSISNMSFFKDMGGYKVSEFKNGTINRVVVDSVMAINFLDNWKKNYEDQCKHIKENATTDVFDNFEDMIERLEKVVTDDVADSFDSKDSFIYFSLFAKFINTGLDDKKYVEFMAEFIQSLHSKEVNGVTYDELCNNRGTKDKSLILKKLDILETLMREYLHIEESKPVTKEEFIAENVELPIEDVREDMSVYEDTLTDLRDNAIRDGSKLLNEENRLSLLAMVAYSYKHDIDLDEWMEEYAANNNTYFVDQKKNFYHMIEDLNKYTKRKAVA